jgi:rfaE bifunctional protein kinase chain/domain
VSPDRFQIVTDKYPQLRITVVGDFCLDRYLEIDPALAETSIETCLPVHNVVNVRAQPGGAGTILNNLVALGIGRIEPVGFCGEDGEGYELRRALANKPGVRLDYFHQSDQRRTFTYCKPLLIEPGRSPKELNRLDSKNWTPTPALLQGRILDSVARASTDSDAMIVLDQVEIPETGVVTSKLLEAFPHISKELPQLIILADSRRGLRGFNGVSLKMNAAELSSLVGATGSLDPADVRRLALELARRQHHKVFVTLADRGIVGANPALEAEHVPALPVRGEIDIVGAGDAVTANLTAALAAGGSLREALEIANAAASIVIHQLGTTGTASIAQIRELLFAHGPTP